MKNDKEMVESNKKRKISGNNSTGNTTKKRQAGVIDSNLTSTATAKTKARAGRGLANEGTIVSYEEER